MASHLQGHDVLSHGSSGMRNSLSFLYPRRFGEGKFWYFYGATPRAWHLLVVANELLPPRWYGVKKAWQMIAKCPASTTSHFHFPVLSFKFIHTQPGAHNPPPPMVSGALRGVHRYQIFETAGATSATMTGRNRYRHYRYFSKLWNRFSAIATPLPQLRNIVAAIPQLRSPWSAF